MVSRVRSRSAWLLTLAVAAVLSCFGASTASAQAERGTITGRVTAEDTGQPLVGATVAVGTTGLGAMTNSEGRFQVREVPPGNHELQFRYLGYRTQRVDVAVRPLDTVVVDAQLGLDPLSLDEVLVTGYGTARREELTGSITAVTAEDIEQMPATTFQDVLQGSPGIQVSAADGAPGAGISIRVRGIGSITAGSEPLYVVDGVPLYNDAAGIGVTSFDNGGRSANTLASLNPNDIESVVVLKDAASTAIYGSRGANGVVLITTKGGVAGGRIVQSSPTLEFKYMIGTSDFAYDNLHRGLTAEQYQDYYLSARLAAGMSRERAEQQFNSHWPVTENNVWGDVITRTGLTQQYDLSASGAGDWFTYFVSGSAWNQEGNVVANHFNRYSTRANLTAQLTDRFNLANNLSYAWTDQTGITDGSAWAAPFYQILFTPPVLPMYDETGEWYAKHTHTMGANHPLGGLMENRRQRETARLINNLTARYLLSDQLTLGSAWSFDVYDVDDFFYNNPRFGDGRNDGGSFEDGRSNNLAWQGTNTVTFQDLIADVHNVNAVAGVELSRSRRDRVNLFGEGFAHPNLKRGLNAAITDGWSDRSTNAFLSGFTQLTYDYDATYYASASFRRDGSSRFGPEERYGNFWSLGTGLTLSNMPWFRDALIFDAVDYLKLRASYGTVGNADIGDYPWQGLYGFAPAYFDLPGAAPAQVANPFLTWESQEAANFGLDYALFDSRISGALEYYHKVSNDLLLNVPVSATSGFTSKLENFGDMENSGIEFSVRADLLRGENYNMGMAFNVTTQDNVITRLQSPFIDGTKRREEGRDYQEYYLYGFAGVDPQTGKALYYTDATKTEITSNVNQIERFYDGKSATPDYLGSFGLNGQYGRFSLNTEATYMFGHYLFEGAARFYEGDGAFLPRSTTQFAYENAWRQPGDNALVPQQIWGGNSGSNLSNSSRWLFKGDHIRLRNVSLGYELPDAWGQRLGTSGISAHVRLQNYFTWVADDLLHFDPEQTISGVYNTITPISKTISFGLSTTF